MVVAEAALVGFLMEQQGQQTLGAAVAVAGIMVAPIILVLLADQALSLSELYPPRLPQQVRQQ